MLLSLTKRGFPSRKRVNRGHDVASSEAIDVALHVKSEDMWTVPPPRGAYHHGNLPETIRAAAREILDQAGPEGVLLREVAQRVGVSATAVYRHFPSREGLLASVAAEGFRELAAAMETAAAETDPLVRTSLAYFEFALQKRGMFRLMFGPILAERAKYPKLTAALDVLEGMVAGVEGPLEENAAAIANWGLTHGLSALFVDGLVPEARARSLVEEIFVRRRDAP
jgi:AcrR family transcriptional regulator